MSSEMGDTDKVIKNLAECREQGIEVLPPDVNEGGASSRWWGAGPLRPFGGQERRREGGRSHQGGPRPHRSVRVALRLLPARGRQGGQPAGVESLVKCGAFDSTGVYRARLMAALDDALKAGQSSQRDRDSSQFGMFDLLEVPPSDSMDAYESVEEWSGGQLWPSRRKPSASTSPAIRWTGSRSPSSASGCCPRTRSGETAATAR